MKKNAHIHLLIESEVLEKLKKEAEEQDILLSELCRHKLRQSHQLDRIESMLKDVNEKLSLKSKSLTT